MSEQHEPSLFTTKFGLELAIAESAWSERHGSLRRSCLKQASPSPGGYWVSAPSPVEWNCSASDSASPERLGSRHTY